MDGRSARYVQLVVEESLNLIPLEHGAHLLLSKIEQDMCISLDITTKNMGVKYLEESSCRDDLSLSILCGLCDVLEERVEGNQHILHMVLVKERLLG